MYTTGKNGKKEKSKNHVYEIAKVSDEMEISMRNKWQS